MTKNNRSASPVDKIVGTNLRMIRTSQGMSQVALAESVGITFQQIQKYEKGVNAMNARRLVDFASFMNIPVSYFFDGLNDDSDAPSVAMAGFAEDNTSFEHDAPSDRESLEMMKAFNRIGEQPVRKRVSDLVRAIADQKMLVD